MEQMPTEKSSMPIIVGILALVLVGGGFLYMQNTAPVSDTEPLTTDAENTATPSNETTEVIPSEVTASGELEAEAVAETKPSVDSTSVTPTPVVTKPVTPSVPVKPVVSTTPTTQYKNGTYSAVGDYRSPEGGETIGIKLTIKDDLIVDAVATLQARDKKSVKYQELFINNFKTLVVGKKLSEVSLGKVSGSSLTPKGFNEAVIEIRSEAKA